MTGTAAWRKFDDVSGLFLVRSWEVDPTVDRRPHHAAHLEWLVAGHDAGQILLSGPSRDRMLGIYLIAADSEQVARDYVASDPYHVIGLREFEVIEWEVQRRSLAAGLTSGPR